MLTLSSAVTPPPAGQEAEAGRRLAANLDSRQSELEADLAELYAETYTAEELAALRAFYSTPEGRSIAAKNAALLPRLVEVGARHTGPALREAFAER